MKISTTLNQNQQFIFKLVTVMVLLYLLIILNF